MSPRAHAALAILLLLQDGAQCCSNVTQLSQQLDALLSEYDRQAAPAQPTTVLLNFELRHARILADATAHALGDLTMSWEDPRITWNASEWNCAAVLASVDRLWVPDVWLMNGASTAVQSSLVVKVTAGGKLQITRRLDAAVPVQLDLSNWPADTQTVDFKFSSPIQDDDELDLKINNILSVVFESGEWQMQTPVSPGKVFTTETESRRVAMFRIQLSRRAAAHVAAAGAVLTAVVLILLAAALLPPRLRPPLCACASFTAALWLMSAMLRLPGSGGVPSCLVSLCVACVVGGAAAVAAAVVSRLATSSTHPPRALATLVSRVSRWCNLVPTEESCSSGVGAWAALAQLLDYVAIATLLIALLVCVCFYL